MENQQLLKHLEFVLAAARLNPPTEALLVFRAGKCMIISTKEVLPHDLVIAALTPNQINHGLTSEEWDKITGIFLSLWKGYHNE